MADGKDPESLKRARAIAHIKFKRKVKCLQLQIDKEGTSENLHRAYDELNNAYEQLEQAHDLYLEEIFLTTDLENEETFMDDVDSIKISITTAYDKALTKCNQDIATDMKKMKLLPEDSQCSSGEILSTNGGKEKQSNPLNCHQVRKDLKIMFPYIGADDIEAALRDRHGDVNETIDQLLATTNGTNTQVNGSKNDKNRNSLQECNICCELYNEDDHRPIVLPCGHTMCKACITKVTSEGWNTMIHCPTCRKYHTINSDELTTNYTVLDLLQASGNSAQQNNENSTSFSLDSKIKFSKSEENHKIEIEQERKRSSSKIPQEKKGNSSTKSDGKSDAGSGFLKKVGIGMGCVAGGAAAVAAAPVVLTGVGFTSAGIAAGSWAASMMSAAAVANGGTIAAGSMVALLQSAGAVGLGAGAAAGVAAAGAAAGGGVAAGVAKLAENKTNDTDDEMLE